MTYSVTYAWRQWNRCYGPTSRSGREIYEAITGEEPRTHVSFVVRTVADDATAADYRPANDATIAHSQQMAQSYIVAPTLHAAAAAASYEQ